ncbi:hypothetical protein HY523_02255 [Candidatus Berkelbacteria bacterium]|nr:hypothetical protein [Candidatus Berkelbacteria bacterium]
MAKYMLPCDMGHESMTMEVEAEDDAKAMAMMKEKVDAHLKAVPHEGMEPMTPEQMEAFIHDHWTKSDDGAVGGDMGMAA